MRTWAIVVLTAAAVGAATVIVGVTLQRRQAGGLEDIPDMIDDCYDRVQRIEQELHRLRPAPGAG